MPAVSIPPPEPPSKLTRKDQLSPELPKAIAQMRRIIDRIRDPANRQYEILDFIASRTDSERIVLHLANALGACIGTMIWPFPPKPMWPMFEKLGPAFLSLGLCDEIWQHSWYHPTGKAFRINVQLWQAAPTYHMVYRQFGHDHILLGKVANRSNGNQLHVCPMRCNILREQRDPARAKWLNQPERAKLLGIPAANEVHKFAKTDERTLAAIMHEFIPELGARDPVGEFAPRASETVVETIKLDAALTPKGEMRPYAEALISRFYGIVLPDDEGRPQLPSSLKSAIVAAIKEARKKHGRNRNVLEFELDKAYLGRLLTGNGELDLDRTIELHLKEITTHHETLVKDIKACRSRSPSESQRLFDLCLLMREDVKKESSKADFAVRLGLDPEQANGERFDRTYKKAKKIVYGGE